MRSKTSSTITGRNRRMIKVATITIPEETLGGATGGPPVTGLVVAAIKVPEEAPGGASDGPPVRGLAADE